MKPQRLKLFVSSKPPDSDQAHRDGTSANSPTPTYHNTELELDSLPPPPFEYPPDIHFSEEELAMPPDQLFRLLRRQVHWAEEDNQELRDEIEALEAKRKEEWQAKELVLANVMEAELANAVSRGENMEKILRLKDDLPHPMLPITGQVPWYRIVEPETREGVT